MATKGFWFAPLTYALTSIMMTTGASLVAIGKAARGMRMSAAFSLLLVPMAVGSLAHLRGATGLFAGYALAEPGSAGLAGFSLEAPRRAAGRRAPGSRPQGSRPPAGLAERGPDAPLGARAPRLLRGLVGPGAVREATRPRLP